MSCGERSCEKFGACSRGDIFTCNVSCPDYKWDGKNPPDSEPARVDYMKVTYKTQKKRR